MNTEQNRFIKERQDSKMSSGEKRVSSYLKEKGIIFHREYFFDELINPSTGNLLFFDFYLPEKNICIEVDGIHHFKPVDGRGELEYQKYKDGLKNKFCKNNSITIIRLQYKKNGKVDLDKLKDFFDGRWERTVVNKKEVKPQVKNHPKGKKRRQKIFRKNDKFKKVVVVWDEEKGFVSPVIIKTDERVEKLRAERRSQYPDDIKLKLGIQ